MCDNKVGKQMKAEYTSSSTNQCIKSCTQPFGPGGLRTLCCLSLCPYYFAQVRRATDASVEWTSEKGLLQFIRVIGTI